MNPIVALAPAYPPLIGEPIRAAPLDRLITDRAGRKRSKQRFAGELEHMANVDVPVPAERLPGLVLNRRRVRGRAGVEHQDAWLVFGDEARGERVVGNVGDNRREG